MPPSWGSYFSLHIFNRVHSVRGICLVRLIV
jgi:hypothetical protein